MIEANTTYLWQATCSVDAKVLCASVPASLSKTQSEFGFAWANEMSASKYRSPSADGQATCCFAHQEQVSLNPKLSITCIRSVSSCPDFRSAESFNYIHADMDISVPMLAFFVSEKHVFAARLIVS